MMVALRSHVLGRFLKSIPSSETRVHQQFSDTRSSPQDARMVPLFAGLLLLVTLCSSNLYGQEVLSRNDPVGYWKFEAANGAAVPDLSGHGNNGIIIPTTAASLVQSSGLFAGTLPFTGNSDHLVRISPTPTLNSLRKQITIAALVYPTRLWKPPSLFSRAALRLERKWNETVAYISKLI